MELGDGLSYYKQDRERWELSGRLESLALQVLDDIRTHGSQPPDQACDRALELLAGVEEWKLGCSGGHARNNSPKQVWQALGEAAAAVDDHQMLAPIMRLSGFGSYVDSESGQQRAKMASAVLRFLCPENWGVVDWRNAAMLTFWDRCVGDCTATMALAKRETKVELRSLFSDIYMEAACSLNCRYRQMRSAALPRAADVDMALFGLSLMAWPMCARDTD